MSVFGIIKDIIKRQFLSGVLVVVPLILTYVVLRFLFEAIDGILSPLIYKLFGYSVPGLGIFATLLLIIITGFLTRSLIGTALYRFGDKLLTNIPIIRIFYMAAKQLVEAITVPNMKAFKEVVRIEYPRPGLYTIGFATSRVQYVQEGGKSKVLVGIFVPSTPTPVTGFVVFVPEEEVMALDLTVENAVKLLVSGGIVSPEILKGVEYRHIRKIEEDNAPGQHA